MPILDTDTCDIRQHFEESNGYIKSVISNPQNKMLIHCFAGKSRASTITLAYLIGEKKMSLSEGLQLIR